MVTSSRSTRLHTRPASATPPAGSLVPWSDASGWNVPQQYETIRAADVDGDGKAELLGRAPTGIDTWVFDVASGQWHELLSAGCGWTDSNGWTAACYYATIRTADVNGDGQAELIGRGPNGIEVWHYDAAGGVWQQLCASACGWSDANGWNQPQYYGTICAGDINGDGQAELIGRGPNGIEVWGFTPDTGRWTQLSTNGCGWSDANGWNQAQYYSTIQLAVNADGLTQLLGRGAAGVEVWNFSTASTWQQLGSTIAFFSDAQHWDQPQYYATIFTADVDGDGQAEILGRGPLGLETFQWSAASNNWIDVGSGGCGWTDAAGWAQPQYYLTIHAADVNGDGQAEILARSSMGLETWAYSAGVTPWQYQQLNAGGCDWTDANNWNQAPYYATIRTADVNADGQAEVLGRSAQGVETWVFNTTVNQWQPSGPRLLVDARFMQNYVVEAAVSSQGQIVTAQNATGDLEVFSIATNGDVYEIYPDPTSDTGWSRVAVGVTADWIAAGASTEHPIVLFAANQGHVSYVVQTPGAATRWSAPQPLGGQLGTSAKVFAGTVAGNLYLAVVAMSSAGSTGFTLTTYCSLWNSATPSLGTAMSGDLQQSTFVAGDWGLDGDAGIWPAFYMMPANGLLYQCSLRNTSEHDATSTLTPMTSAPPGPPQPPGSSSVFMPPSLSVLQGSGKPVLWAVRGQMLWWLSPSIGWTWHLQQASIPLLSVRAGWSAAGPAEVFAVSAANRLYRLQAVPTGVFGPLIELGQAVSQIAYGRNAQQYSQVFATSAGTNNLITVWQDPDTSDWNTTPIDVESLGTVRPIISYTTEITILDTIGQATRGCPVTISTPDLEMLTINGQTFWVDQARPATVTTNAVGTVTVVVASDSLATPLLQVGTAFMGTGATVMIEPNADVQAQLRAVTGQQLLEAKDAAGNSLLVAPYNTLATADQMAHLVRQSLTLVAPEAGPASAGARRMLRPHGHRQRRFTSRIDVRVVPRQHWRANFTTGVPVFESLTPFEARARLAHMAATYPDVGTSLGLDWGDVWSAITEGVGTLAQGTNTFVDMVISTTAHGITVGLTCIIDGITYVYNGVITLIEQAFDIIEGLFEKVGASFARLFEWLGVLFNWPDILLTKQAVAWTVNQAILFLPDLLAYVGAQANNYFTTLRQQVGQAMDEVIASDLLSGSLITIAQDNAPPVPGLQEARSNNLVMTAFINNLDHVPTEPHASMAAVHAQIAGPLETLLTSLRDLSQTFQTGTSFSHAYDYFAQVAPQLMTNPDQALLAAVAGTLEVVAGLVDVAIGTVQLIVNALLAALTAIIQAFQALLNDATWDRIPFVADLYHYIANGATLTPLDLVSLMIAVPTTVLYKVANQGQAPFTPQTLAQFQQAFTARALAQACGLGPVDPPVPVTVLQSFQERMKDSLPFIFRATIGASVLNGLTNGGGDVLEPKPGTTAGTGSEMGLSVFAVIAESMVWLLTCPQLVDPTPPDFVTPAGTRLAVWLCTPMIILSDGACIWMASKKSSMWGDAGVGITIAVGLVRLGLFSYLVHLQRSAQQYTALGTAANMLDVVPQIFKFLRFSAIAKAKPYGQAALVALGVITWSTLTASGICEAFELQELAAEEAHRARAAFA
jgi:hypothetical protein